MQIEKENRDLVDKLNTMAEMMDQNENRTVDSAAPKQGGAPAKEKNTQQNSRTCVILQRLYRKESYFVLRYLYILNIGPGQRLGKVIYKVFILSIWQFLPGHGGQT